VSELGAAHVNDSGAASARTTPASVNAVLFDLYGTLINIRTDENDPGVYVAMAQFLEYVGVRITPEELLHQYRSRVRARLEGSPEKHAEVDVTGVFRDLIVAYGVPGASSSLLPAGRFLDPDTLAAAVSGLFRSLTRRSFGVFLGVEWALAHLQPRYRLALVSNAQRVFAESELVTTGLDRFFPVRVLSAVVGIKKPDSRIFSAALHALGVEPADAVYVGDNPKDDLVGARNAGMRCIIFGADGIEYDGLHPDACFRNHGDLPALLDRLWG
jgi:putative hydrolase of the HAD superfamily